ncbi:MAG: FtsX-like permease family protein [Hellea sp.]|nr:FtsX-like permease family protein [Hellea sp.]
MNELYTPDSNGGQNRPFGAVERKIARRYLGAKKSEGGVAIIAWISFICIMLAITAMITIMSIMNGFRAKVLELTLGTQGHVFVEILHANMPPDDIKAIEQRLAAMPGVKTAMEITTSPVGFMANEQLFAGQVMGISNQGLADFKIVSENIEYGNADGFGLGGGSDHQILMGGFLAAGMGLNVNDRVRILTPKTRASAFGPPTPISKIYTVGGIFRTGLYATDTTTVFMEIEQAKLLFGTRGETIKIQMRLDDPDRVESFKEPVAEAVALPASIETWHDRNKTQYAALKTEQIAMRLIFVIVVIISVFPILAAMLMLVKNKAKDIAILRTIGSTRGSILRIFFIAGTMIGFLGTIVGLVLGVLLCLNMPAVQKFIEVFTGPLFPPDIYQITGGIPTKIVWTEVIAVALCGFIISAIATFFPSWGASKTDPVDALRYE